MVSIRPLRIVLFALLVGIAFSGRLAAQSGVTVQLFQPPPNQLKIADFWRIRLTNNTQNTYTVCLFGTLDETDIGKRLVEATTARFTLPPGTRLVTGADIQPIDAEYFDDRYKNAFLRTGQAPTGSYRICVEVRLDCGSQVLATDCKSQTVQQLTPPILISPPNESTVEEPLPAFSWAPPSPLRAGQRLSYTLKIVEVLGRQTGYDAMQSNPAWFERRMISTTVIQYPISARKFTPNTRYAWRIVASDGDFPMGESEIWEFTYIPRKPIFSDEDGGLRRDTTKRIGMNNTDIGIIDFKPKGGGKNLKFLDPAAHQRGVAVLERKEGLEVIGGIRLVDLDAVRDKLKTSIPQSLLNELLRSCQGE